MRKKTLFSLSLLCVALFLGAQAELLPVFSKTAPYAAASFSYRELSGRAKASFAAVRLPDTLLPVDTVYQWPEMPNGCEAGALTTLLQYYGFAADKVAIAYNYIPRADLVPTMFGNYGPDPAEAYAGDPKLFGFYCLAPAVAQGANAYLKEQGSSLRASDVTGADVWELTRYVASGRPVVFWATIDFEPIVYSQYSWNVFSTGETYRPYKNLHCLVLNGFDETFFYVCDPLYGERAIPRETFIERYEDMGRGAVVLDKAPAE